MKEKEREREGRRKEGWKVDQDNRRYRSSAFEEVLYFVGKLRPRRNERTSDGAIQQ